MIPTVQKLKKCELPKINGRINVRGLNSGVKIVRDKYGCPHISARTPHDAWFAQGFVHAQDRLWQMERSRRFARGTMAEILGEPLIKIDRYYRRLGIQRLAVRDFPQLNDEAQSILLAFTEGVNNAIDSLQELPPEFQVLDFLPEKWSPVDSIAVWKIIFLTQTNDINLKIFRAAIMDELGYDALKILSPENYPEDPVISGQPFSVKNCYTQTDEMLDFVKKFSQHNIAGSGSNNWVVNNNLSATGKPLLASDPHGVIQTAPIWYMHHLRCPEWEITGVNTPGVPGILLFGHNPFVGWSVTNAMPDAADLYIEKFDADYQKYLYKGKWIDAEIRHEEIKVKGIAEPVTEDVPVTVHGPVISGNAGEKGSPLAWRWTGQQVTTVFECIEGMCRARNVDEFRNSQVNWAGPAMNRVIADVNGNIAYQLLPEIPVRKHRAGLPVPVNGWDGEHEWQGMVPFQELPWLKNPENNYILTANHRVVCDDYRHHIGEIYIPYRAQRLEEMLSVPKIWEIDDFKSMQHDTVSVVAREMRNIILDYKEHISPAACELLSNWDGAIEKNSVAAALYGVFIRQLLNKLFAVTEGLAGRQTALEWWWLRYLNKIMQSIKTDDRGIIDLSQETRGMTWGNVITSTVESAWQELEHKFGKDRRRWQWGKLHRQSFVHNLGRIHPYDVYFNLPSIGISGDGTTVFNSGGPYPGSYEPAVGVSFRMILDFSDFSNSLWILPPGNSGHPNSRHYCDNINSLNKKQYNKMLWDWTEIMKKPEGILYLVAKVTAAL